MRTWLQARIILAISKLQDVLRCANGWLSIRVLRCKAWTQGVIIGKNVSCWGPVILRSAYPGSISLGSFMSIVSTSPRATASSIYAPTKLQTLSSTARIILEDGVGVNGVSIVARSKTILIGKNVMIAPNCTIVDSDFHALWPAEGRLRNPGISNDADVHTGNNVWLGMQCIVLKGVTVGDGTIIAAGSVVTKDIPPNCLAAGVPARVIRNLP